MHVLKPFTAAGERAYGGSAVVTLEPCNHHGHTPPCHQALIEAGIARVVISVIDPTSRGEGDGGVRTLLVDGRCSFAGSFLEAGWVDQAVAYIESNGPSGTGLTSADTEHFAGRKDRAS